MINLMVYGLIPHTRQGHVTNNNSTNVSVIDTATKQVDQASSAAIEVDDGSGGQTQLDTTAHEAKDIQ